MSDPQYDHHCWVTFMGGNWRITRIERRYMVHVARAWLGILPGTVASIEMTVIDISRVDWEAYCEAAVNWDRRYANGLD